MYVKKHMERYIEKITHVLRKVHVEVCRETHQEGMVGNISRPLPRARDRIKYRQGYEYVYGMNDIG